MDMELLLKYLRVNALTEAQSYYAITPDLGGAPGHATYVGSVKDGSSEAAVVAIDRIDQPKHTLQTGRRLVSKVAFLEKMPKKVARAQTSLMEMYMGVVTSGSVGLVSLDAVRNAAEVLFAPPSEPMAFDPDAVVTPLLPFNQRIAPAPDADPLPHHGSAFTSDDTGDAYLNYDHLLIAVRLLVQIRGVQTAPTWYVMDGEPEETANERWLAEVEDAFGRFSEEAAHIGITAKTISLGRVPCAPRSFGHQRNTEHINEVVASARVSLLYHARTAVAFTPIVDHFAFRARDDTKSIALHMITPRHDKSFVKALREHGEASFGPTLDGIRMMRSVLAQVLLSLEAAQTHLRFTHYDLHINNVMLDQVEAHDPEHTAADGTLWYYVRPGGKHSFMVPASDSDGQAARIIDFGRTRCDDPRFPGNDARASSITIEGRAPCALYDTAADMRALAHDIVVYGLFKWRKYFVYAGRGDRVSSDSAVEECFLQMVSVLEDMSGVRWWNGWNAGVGPATYMQRNGRQLDPPTSLYSYIDLWATGICDEDTFIQIRADEFIMRRPDGEHSVAPSDVLESPFFLPYRVEEVPAGAVLVPVADATHAPPVKVGPSPTVSEESDVQMPDNPPGSTKKRRCVE